jgi:hypothetical protein
MKIALTILILMAVSLPARSSSRGRSVEYVAAPGGRTTYYILADAQGNSNRIEAGLNGNRSFQVLLTAKPSTEPEHNLTDFSHLRLSPDGKTLYFEASAWVTSNAVHSLNIATGKVSYVTSGEIACLVLQGEHQGDLIVEQHRYFVQGGSFDALYLYEPTGKEVGIVSLGNNASRVCPVFNGLVLR